MWNLTSVFALFLHGLTKGHRSRSNVVRTFSAFGFALGLVPNVEFDLGPVVCVMAAGASAPGQEYENVHGKCDSQKHDLSLIRVLAIYSKHNFMLALAVDFQCDDGSPGLFRSQHSQVLGAENWKMRVNWWEYFCNEKTITSNLPWSRESKGERVG